jgi:DNA topoisomerase-1
MLDQKEALEDQIEQLKSKKKGTNKNKDLFVKRSHERDQRRAERICRQKAERKLKRDKLKADREKLLSEGKLKKEQLKEEIVSEDDDEIKEIKIPDDLSKCESQLEKLDIRIENYRGKIALKDENKAVALGTSKINYMDPRITVAWCKAKQVPIEKIFNKSLVAKFPWAMEVPPDWTF